LQSRSSKTARTTNQIQNNTLVAQEATMAATISTNTSTSALSPSGAWWATASTEKASRVTIRQAESLRVHCTLRNNTGHSNATAAVAEWSTNDADSSPPRRVLQWLSETLVATMTRNQSNTVVILTVFDVTRGVVAYTKEYSFGSNSSTSDVAALRDTDHADVADYTFVDWAVALLPQQQKPQSVVDTLVVAVQTKRSKLLLLVYHAVTGKLLQKIKAGKANTASSSSSSFCALAMGSSRSDGKNDLAVWHCGSHLRVTSLVTGLKVAKISLDRHNGHNSLATYASSQLIWSVAGHVAAAIPGTKGSTTTTTTTTTVMLYNVRTGQQLNGPILGLSSSSPSATIQLAVSGSGDDGAKSSYWLLLDSQSLIQLTITTAEDAHEADSFVVTKTCRLSTPLPTMDDCIQYYFTSSQLVAVRHTSLASTTAAHGLQVCRVDLSKTLDEIAVSFDAESNAITTNAAAAALDSKKRKPTVVLGPGQAGGEARHVTEVGALSNKRSKSAESDPTDRTNDDQDNDDDNGPTIAERLAQLQKIMDEDMEMDDDDEGDKDTNAATTTTTSPPFVPRHATTESLAHLLTQALQSSDTVLLEQALAVRDAALVRTTCRGLDATSAVALLQALTQRLATKPARAEQLVPWMAALLQSNHVSSVHQLQPLQNLLQERLEVFPLLLQLEGRLEHMTATM
jgi:Dip2/Utp12 Family